MVYAHSLYIYISHRLFKIQVFLIINKLFIVWNYNIFLYILNSKLLYDKITNRKQKLEKPNNYKYVLNTPQEIIDGLGWNNGNELELLAVKVVLIINNSTYIIVIRIVKINKRISIC
jgi:hypothetical protein